MNYRKKPVVIQAVQYDGTAKTIKAMNDLGCVPEVYRDSNQLGIKTLEGTMIAQPGDWIIKGVKGEFYPCKPDIFAATYDPVGE